METKQLFEKLERQANEGKFARESTGGEIDLLYVGKDYKGNKIKIYVRRFDIDYMLDGVIVYNVYYCRDNEGKFEDINIFDKRNNINYSQVYTNTPTG